ncbi:MAG: DUF1540 domain-containing protein [Lachnospiraceae bacterium]|nr:DUF1540 domain-containing protein [Lachnospiraceae bacterium]
MARLGCGVSNCIYNQEHCCCKGDIMVGGRDAVTESDTCCESFADQRGDFYANMMESPKEMIHVDCEAVRCIYNDNYKCRAEQINIQGDHADTCGDTLCATFTERQL